MFEICFAPFATKESNDKTFYDVGKLLGKTTVSPRQFTLEVSILPFLIAAVAKQV